MEWHCWVAFKSCRFTFVLSRNFCGGGGFALCRYGTVYSKRVLLRKWPWKPVENWNPNTSWCQFPQPLTGVSCRSERADNSVTYPTASYVTIVHSSHVLVGKLQVPFTQSRLVLHVCSKYNRWTSYKGGVSLYGSGFGEGRRGLVHPLLHLNSR